MGRALPRSLSDADRGVTSEQRRRWRAGRRARVRRLSRHSRAVRQLHALLMPSRQLRGDSRLTGPEDRTMSRIPTNSPPTGRGSGGRKASMAAAPASAVTVRAGRSRALMVWPTRWTRRTTMTVTVQTQRPSMRSPPALGACLLSPPGLVQPHGKVNGRRQSSPETHSRAWTRQVASTTLKAPDLGDLEPGETIESRYEYDGERLIKAWNRKMCDEPKRHVNKSRN